GSSSSIGPDQKNQDRRVVLNVTKRRRQSMVRWGFAHRKARNPKRNTTVATGRREPHERPDKDPVPRLLPRIPGVAASFSPAPDPRRSRAPAGHRGRQRPPRPL